MPTLHVHLFAGRTIDQKRALARALTEATVATLGVPATAVDVIFTDVEKHDWATGGRLCSDPVEPPPPPGA